MSSNYLKHGVRWFKNKKRLWKIYAQFFWMFVKPFIQICPKDYNYTVILLYLPSFALFWRDLCFVDIFHNIFHNKALLSRILIMKQLCRMMWLITYIKVSSFPFPVFRFYRAVLSLLDLFYLQSNSFFHFAIPHLCCKTRWFTYTS